MLVVVAMFGFCAIVADIYVQAKGNVQPCKEFVLSGDYFVMQIDQFYPNGNGHLASKEYSFSMNDLTMLKWGGVSCSFASMIALLVVLIGVCGDTGAQANSHLHRGRRCVRAAAYVSGAFLVAPFVVPLAAICSQHLSTAALERKTQQVLQHACEHNFYQCKNATVLQGLLSDLQGKFVPLLKASYSECSQVVYTWHLMKNTAPSAWAILPGAANGVAAAIRAISGHIWLEWIHTTLSRVSLLSVPVILLVTQQAGSLWLSIATACWVITPTGDTASTGGLSLARVACIVLTFACILAWLAEMFLQLNPNCFGLGCVWSESSQMTGRMFSVVDIAGLATHAACSFTIASIVAADASAEAAIHYRSFTSQKEGVEALAVLMGPQEDVRSRCDICCCTSCCGCFSIRGRKGYAGVSDGVHEDEDIPAETHSTEELGERSPVFVIETEELTELSAPSRVDVEMA